MQVKTWLKKRHVIFCLPFKINNNAQETSVSQCSSFDELKDECVCVFGASLVLAAPVIQINNAVLSSDPSDHKCMMYTF